MLAQTSSINQLINFFHFIPFIIGFFLGFSYYFTTPYTPHPTPKIDNICSKHLSIWYDQGKTLARVLTIQSLLNNPFFSRVGVI